MQSLFSKNVNGELAVLLRCQEEDIPQAQKPMDRRFDEKQISASSKNHAARTGEFSTSCISVFCAELEGKSGGTNLLSLLTVESNLSSLLIVELVPEHYLQSHFDM